jgi:hypothetical protein
VVFLRPFVPALRRSARIRDPKWPSRRRTIAGFTPRNRRRRTMRVGLHEGCAGRGAGRGAPSATPAAQPAARAGAGGGSRRRSAGTTRRQRGPGRPPGGREHYPHEATRRQRRPWFARRRPLGPSTPEPGGRGGRRDARVEVGRAGAIRAGQHAVGSSACRALPRHQDRGLAHPFSPVPGPGTGVSRRKPSGGKPLNVAVSPTHPDGWRDDLCREQDEGAGRERDRVCPNL